MYGRWKKFAAAIAAAAMLASQCMTVGMAEETLAAETQEAAETETQVPETESQAPETQAPETQAPETQAPETQAPETESQAPETQAPETESQAPETQAAETQAPETESQATETQAPETQASETQESETESQTPKPQETESPASETEKPASETEKPAAEKSETESETETERSRRENTGDKLKTDALVKKLSGVLPYLFAAQSVEGADSLPEEQKLIQGGEGEKLVGALKEYSLELANAQSSDEVCVINLYADEDGELDVSFLEEQFPDKVIDVASQYYVINIIADSEDQTLEFSGFSMKNAGNEVIYEEETQVGDIVYNFAALDGDTYTDYKGTLKLTGTLQGTFLAPEASVEVGGNLAGAVYADSIKVQSSVTELMRIVFATELPEDSESETEAESAAAGNPSVVQEIESGAETLLAAETNPNSETETQPDTETESDSGTETQPGTETDSDSEAETDSDSGTETQPDTETESGSETETQPDTETESDSETETQPDTETESDSETETQPDTETESDSETETQPDTETESDSETETQPDTETESETELPAETESEAVSSAVSVKFTVKLQDSESGEALAGTVAVKAAQNITDASGANIFTTDAVVESQTMTKGSAKFGTGQTTWYTGDYYMEITSLPDGYQQLARIYFQVTEDGLVFQSQNWDAQTSVLTLELSKEGTETTPVLTLLDENGGELSGAEFVVKDEDGNVLKSTAGYAKYDIHYNGTPVMLTGLTEGTYYLSEITAPEGYQIAADQKFTIPGESELTVVNKKTGSGKTIRVSAEVLFEDTVLTAVKDTSRYAAVFTGKEGSRTRVSEVKELSFDSSSAVSDTVSFAGLTGSSYYVAPTSEFGELLESTDELTVDGVSVKFSSGDTKKDAVLQYQYHTGSYPDGEFSYTAQVSITLNVLGKDGNALETQETFYVGLYRNASLKSAITSSPVAFAMNGASSKTVKYSFTMTKETGTYYLAETNSKGSAVAASDSFAYAVTYPSHKSGSFTVSCGQDTALTVQNKLNDSLVKLRVTDASGSYLSGAVLAIKDNTGSILKVLSETTFESKSKDLEWTNILEDGATYYLTEITAPTGYLPAPDVEFTVKAGSTTEVPMENAAVQATGYQLSVTKQVYVGENQVYAKDNSSGQYAADGAYRFYFALFSDAARTQKVSNVLSLDVEGFSGSVVFQNLTAGEIYYVSETNEYGEVVASSSSLTVKYADSGKVTMSEKSRTMAVQNVYSSLPGGYRYTGTLTIVKQTTNSSGEAEAVTKTFYAGIYRSADYSDTPTIVQLDLQNASSVSAKRRILLSGDNDVTYYIAEVDASGVRITDDSDFGYVVKIDQPTVTVTKSGEQTVTITNKAKSSKATLYITKKVYSGATQKTVNETFYAGLFKDSSFTQLYTNPIALKLENKSELTLKLTLNLGSASGATVYVAEVDEDGNVIKNERSFGYQIKIVNSTAAFDQDHLEIRSVLLNSVYGTTSDDEWNSIVDSNSDSTGTSTWSDNGTTDGSSAVQTGDDTPLTGYAAAMTAALAVLGYGWFRKRKCRR